MVKKCYRCGSIIRDTVKVCPRCGWSFLYDNSLKRCPRCGNVVRNYRTNCPKCGWDFSPRFYFKDRISNYDVYALVLYLKKKDYPSLEDLPDDSLEMKMYFAFREDILKFKEGELGDMFLYEITGAIKKEKLITNRHRTIVCAIPASRRATTRKRWKNFLAELSNAFGVNNGYWCIRGKNREIPKHLGGGHPSEEDFEYKISEIRGKDILLFDDIITSGITFKSVADKLMQYGAAKVTGIFLGRTYSKEGMWWDYEKDL